MSETSHFLCVLCVCLTADDYCATGVDIGSSNSLLTNLSQQYLTTQIGSTSTQHGTHSAAQFGVGGYFATDGEQAAGPTLQPGAAIS